ncbi:methyltransferase family protein, partial [Vibrio rumoiensis]
MKWLELRVKPPIVAIIAVMVMFLLEYYVSNEGLGLGQLGWSVILALVIVGFMFAIAGVNLFFKSETTIHPDLKHATNKLVITGVYRVSRNPMYLGMLLNLVAVSVWMNNWLSIGVCVGFVLYISQFQIKPEERFLKDKFGQEYQDYCHKVRR